MTRCLHHHSLSISNAERSLEFYVNQLGMMIVGHTKGRGHEPDCYHLSFGGIDDSRLELLCDRRDSPVGYQHDDGDLYWKTNITVPDLDVARERLYFKGIQVSEPSQFADVGYMCHLRDPDGYIIELLQHTFGRNAQPVEPDPDLRLGTQPTLAHVTLRCKNPAVTIPFYRDLLGMRLLSRQQINDRGFTLYFLAYTDEVSPSGDINSVQDREWLWQRPYTMIELQHIRRREEVDFEYRTDEDGPYGFRGVTVSAADRQELFRQTKSFEFTVESPESGYLQPGEPFILRDPDGTQIRIIDSE